MAHSNEGVKKYLQQRKCIKATRKLSALLLHATKKIKETTKTKDVEKRDL